MGACCSAEAMIERIVDKKVKEEVAKVTGNMPGFGGSSGGGGGGGAGGAGGLGL